jgi:hypothetical protein
MPNGPPGVRCTSGRAVGAELAVMPANIPQSRLAANFR